jgi:hypothetical protein
MDFKIILQYPRQEVNTKSKENTKFLKQILRKKEMKKFFAIALAFVMFAATNMFAQESGPGITATPASADATIEVTVLQKIEVTSESHLIFAVVEGTDSYINETTDDVASLLYNVQSTGGYGLTYSLSHEVTSTPSGQTAPVISLNDNNTATNGTVETGENGGNINLEFAVTGIDATLSEDGEYVYTYTLSVYYTGF